MRLPRLASSAGWSRDRRARLAAGLEEVESSSGFEADELLEGLAVSSALSWSAAAVLLIS